MMNKTLIISIFIVSLLFIFVILNNNGSSSSSQSSSKVGIDSSQSSSSSSLDSETDSPNNESKQSLEKTISKVLNFNFDNLENLNENDMNNLTKKMEMVNTALILNKAGSGKITLSKDDAQKLEDKIKTWNVNRK